MRGGGCYANSERCDGQEQCSDGSDEYNCGKQYRRMNYVTVIKRMHVALKSLQTMTGFIFLLYIVSLSATGVLNVVIRGESGAVCAQSWLNDLNDLACDLSGKG